MVKNVLVMTNHFTRYALVVVTKDQMAKMVTKVFYEHFIALHSSMGATPTRAPAGLQQHPVSGDQLFAALSDVWEASTPPC